MPEAPIALIGKLGHGKTYLLNKVCGAHFPSHMGARSCTRTVQLAYTRRNKIPVIDTPGFCSSEDVAAHVAAQKYALEGLKLSGVYVVIKYARADDIVEMMQKIMNFVGNDDIRIIITHSDIACGQTGFNEREMKNRISDLLDVRTANISIIGKNTNATTIERFIESTRHTPKEFKISEEQIALISSLSVGSRRLNKTIDQAFAKIEAASKECFDLTKIDKCYQTDVAITTIQNATTTMVRETKDRIFRDADELTQEQQNFVYGKAGLSLSLRLKDFIEATNKCLSWDVTAANDPRNAYRECPHCGAVFNKTEGCDGATNCGDVPGNSFRQGNRKFLVQFKAWESGWVIQYFLDGYEIRSQYVREKLATQTRKTMERGSGTRHIKRQFATFESGCGASITWSTMRPVDPARIAALGNVEIERPGLFEEVSKVKFNDRVNDHEEANRRILREFMSRGS